MLRLYSLLIVLVLSAFTLGVASAAPPAQPEQPQPTHLLSGRTLPADMPAPPPLDSAALAAEIETAILTAQLMTTAACQDEVEVASSADSGPGTLRQALIDVCTGGEITFAEQPVDFFILLTTGQLVVDKDVAIYGEQRVYLSGGEASRVFLVGPGAALALDGVTIYDTIRPTEAGAGVLVAGDGTLLTSNETYFFRNRAADGGALMVMPGGTAVLDRTDFFDNRALNRGGAIYALGTLLLTNVQVEGNSGAIGAGLFAAGLTSIDQCVIRDNRATLWGGAVSNEGRMLIANSEISENRANEAGGIDNVGLLAVDGSSIVANQARRNVGISNVTGPAIGYPGVAEIIITASSITSNTATDGSIGGITNYDGLAYIERSAIVSNVAEDASNIAHVGLTPDARTILQDVTVSGGSASSSVLGAVTIAGSGAVTLTNVTVAANDEAGIVYWAEEGLPAPQVTVRNSLVALNAGKDFGTAVSQPDGSAQPANTPFTLTTSGHNLFGIADNVVGLDGTTDRFGSLAQPLDPAISSLELSNNTYVHPLRPGSPAIDGGGNPCSPVDQRGMPRQGACDIGAFEFDYNIYYLDLDTRRDQASYLLNDLYPAQSGAGVTAQVYAGALTTVDLGVGLAATGEALPVSYGQTLTVGAEARFLYVAADPGGQRHVTLVIGRDDNGNDQYDPEEELCRSAVSSAVVQVCSLDKNMLVPGNYWLYVVQPEGTATTVDLLISDGSALAGFALAAAPAAVTLGQPFDVRLFWQAPLPIGAARAGVIEIVDQSALAQVMAPIGFRLTRLPTDVTKSAHLPDDELLSPGETIPYTITVLPEPAAIHEGITVYTLTDTLPDGVTYVAGSATVTPTSISGNTLVWRLDTQGVTTTVRYQVQVGMATRGLLTNTVVATLDLPNAGATASATVVEVADVILDISMAAPTAIAGGPITYTFTITNEGVGASDPLTVRTVVPANTLHRSGGSVDADGVVTWQLPALAAGGATQVQMAVDPLGVGMAQLGQAARTTAASAAPDIVGGGPADPGAWPWQVALLGKASNRQFCGGSLIAPDLVLTAAHCLEKITERVADIISIWVGAHDLTELDQGQIIDVSYVALHPGYDPYSLDYDIALLRLAEPAQLSAAVQPVQLATRADEDRYRPGTVAAVTGWGELAYGGESPDILHEVSVGIVDQNACDAVYSTLAGEPGIITDRMICAGFPEGGKDSCRGDSGGPLVVPDGAGGWLQVGIVSWGGAPEDQPKCAAAGYPGVYASVPTLLNWIEGPGQSTYMAPEYVEVTDGSGRPGGTAIAYGALVSTVVGLWERVFLPTVVK